MDNTAVEILDRAIRERTRALRTQAKRCRKQFSEEAVHDLRVAMRRLLALRDFLAFFSPAPALRKMRRELKTHLDALDELRDTQVMLLETSQRISELPALEMFHRFLQKQEKRLMRRAQKDIASLKDGSSKPLRAGLKAITSHNENILAPVDEAYQTVLHRLALIDERNTATIHRVRIAFKRFRYSVEVVKPLLATMPEETLQRLHDYQTLMGEIQDMEVMLRAIDQLAAAHSECSMEPVRQFYQQMHEQKVAAYIQRMNEVYSFWRTAPERPFPWEVGAGVETAGGQEAEEQEALEVCGECGESEPPSELAFSDVTDAQPVEAGSPPSTDLQPDEKPASPNSQPTQEEEVRA